MATYDIAFSIKLADIAQGIELDSYEARRTVVYLSRLSMELSLKAFLEKAGKSVSEIRGHSHDIRKLLMEVGKCEVEVNGSGAWHSAARLRALTISFQNNEIPVGFVLDAEDQGASVYPNEIRYGEDVKDFPPEVLAPVAMKVAAWVHEHNVVRCLNTVIYGLPRKSRQIVFLTFRDESPAVVYPASVVGSE